MNINYKLYFKYILFNTNQLFLKYLIRNDKNLNIFITQKDFYYLALHFKLSSLFYSLQLIDIFAYELPINQNFDSKHNPITGKLPLINNSLLVYNFHSVLFQQRIFVFVTNGAHQSINKNSINWASINSITELFLNAN